MKCDLRSEILRELRVTKADSARSVSWRSYDRKAWGQALAWMDLGGLAIYFLHCAKTSGSYSALPDEVQSALERRATSNRIRTAEIGQEFRTLTGLLHQTGVKYAVLKGISLIPDYCPDPRLRTQYDHDVLIDGACAAAAHLALSKAGYRRKASGDESVLVYRKPQAEVRFSEESEALYSSELGRSIELHRTLWEETEEKIHVILPDDFLTRSRSRRWEGVDFIALCDEDCLLFQVLHAFKHILRNWCRLSTLLEIAFFLHGRSSDAAFWNRFVERIERVRWAPEATLVVFRLAEQVFGSAIPPALEAALNTPSSPAMILWIEKYGRRAAMSNFCGDKCSLFLHREFVENASEWSVIFRRRLFPLRRPHRPPPVVFQRGFSTAGRVWLEKIHALKRLRFHSLAGLRYALEYPRWIILRRLRSARLGEV